MKSTTISVALLVTLCSSCQPSELRPVVVEAGMTSEEVTERYGVPDRTVEFFMPTEPYFGPAEGLWGVVESGTSVEEWVYVVGDNETYVWFAQADSTSKSRSILNAATYPIGAIF